MMIIIAACALFLGASVWLFRQRQTLILAELRAAEQAVLARDQAAALQAQVLAGLAQAADNAKASGAESSGTVSGSALAANDRKIWASLSVNHAVVAQDELTGLVAEFSLVNDGGEAVDPGIGRSYLVLNGHAVVDSLLVVGTGSIDRHSDDSMPSGGRVQFTRKLDDLFRSPGIYRLSWRGEAFRSPEVTIRVLPAKAR
jgi:hypothetical protein